MKRIVMLCGTKNECDYYMHQLLSDPQNEDKGYHVSPHYQEVTNDDEHYFFMTPDDVPRKRGMRIDEYRLLGTVHERHRWPDAVDLLKTMLN